jgi:hypothetical protein
MKPSLMGRSDFVPSGPCGQGIYVLDPAEEKGERTMKKLFALFLAGSLIAVLLPAQAFAWGFASHAYVADELLKRWEQEDFLVRNLNEIYASMSPDLVNFAFDLGEFGLFVQDILHEDIQFVVDEEDLIDAHWKEQGLAYGFASHNDLWGADFTAHHSGRTYGQDVGWVIQKSIYMNSILQSPNPYGLPPIQDVLVYLGMTGDLNALALDLYHYFVEFSSDVLVAGIDPMIGPKIIMSVAQQETTDGMVTLLMDAYEEDIPPDVFIFAEPEFRYMLAAFGGILTLDEELALTETAGLLTGFAPAFLGVVLTEQQMDDLELLINGYLILAANLCRDDLGVELDATIKYVEKALKDHGIKK